MILFRPPRLSFGRRGTLPADFPTGGDLPSPLASVAVLPGDASTEFIWDLDSPLIDGTSNGVTAATDPGGYAHDGADDGSYVQYGKWAALTPSGTVTTGVIEIDLLFGSATNNVVASLSAALAIARSATASVSAALQVTRTRTASIDAALHQARSTSAAVNAALRAPRSSTASVAAALQAARTATATLQAFLQAGSSVSASLNAAVVGHRAAVASLSAALATRRTTTASLAAAVAVTRSASASLSAYLAMATALQASMSAALSAQRGTSASLNAYIDDGSVEPSTPSTFYAYRVPGTSGGLTYRVSTR